MRIQYNSLYHSITISPFVSHYVVCGFPLKSFLLQPFLFISFLCFAVLLLCACAYKTAATTKHIHILLLSLYFIFLCSQLRLLQGIFESNLFIFIPFLVFIFIVIVPLDRNNFLIYLFFVFLSIPCVLFFPSFSAGSVTTKGKAEK